MKHICAPSFAALASGIRVSRRALFLSGLALNGAQSATVQRGGVAQLAMVGDPEGLDPTLNTSDLVGTIMQHVYEPLYTFDANWQVAPMLAKSLPQVSKDGLRYTITLREGVKLHSGRTLDANDVVASLNRWMELSPRGMALSKVVASLHARNALIVELVLREPYAPLLAQLALPSSMAAIMAKESIAPQLTSFVGTGPYQVKERRPFQYTVLVRHTAYSARTEAPSAAAGRREALLDELRFLSVPNPSIRMDGALSGQYHFADALPVGASSLMETISNTIVPVVTRNSGFPYIVFNTRAGVMAPRAMRRAVQTAVGQSALMAAAFGDGRLYVAEPNFFPKDSPYFSLAGANRYNLFNPVAAKAQAARAGYQGEPVRILVSRQYEFHYKIALALEVQLRNAGLMAQLQVVDWASLIQRRAYDNLWDLYITHSGLLPEPMLSPPQLGEGAPGWWDSPAKRAALRAFNREIQPDKRARLWARVQQVVYDEVPFMELGKYNSIAVHSAKLVGYTPSMWPFFWNAGLRAP